MRAEAKLLAAAPGHGPAVLEEDRDVDLGPAVEPLGERAHGLGAERQPVDLAGAVGGADRDVGTLEAAPPEQAEIGVGVLEPGRLLDPGLAVVGAEHHRVPLEERVGPAGDVHQRGDRLVGVGELAGGAFRAERVRRVVVVREVEDEEVEAVARDEPAADRGRVLVDRSPPRGLRTASGAPVTSDSNRL